MFVFFFYQSLSWWGHSHIIIGRIAESFLTTKQTQKINNVIQSHQLPQQTIKEVATWQDDLKDTNGLRTFYQWHFSDDVYQMGRCTKCNFQEPTYNITTYLLSAYKTLTNPTTTSDWAWGFHLRSIIHFVGDVHMPLHNTAMYSDDFPRGDSGGNGYTLNCNYGSSCNNVHFFWDSVGNLFSLMNPLIPKQIKIFEQNVTKLKSEFPESSYTYNLNEYNPMLWHNESFELAKTKCYTTPMNQWPSDQYTQETQTVAKKRVAAAGYRLGYFLRSVADNVPASSESYVTEIVAWCINVVLVIVSAIFVFINARKTPKYSYLSH